MSGVSSNLVAESLRLHKCNVVKDLLVDVEIEGHVGVVLLDQLSGGSLHGFGSDSSLIIRIPLEGDGLQRTL